LPSWVWSYDGKRREVRNASLLSCSKPSDGYGPSPQLPHIDFPAAVGAGYLVANTYLGSEEDDDEDYYSLLGWLNSPTIIRDLIRTHEAFKPFLDGSELSEKDMDKLHEKLDRLVADALQDQVGITIS